MSRAPDRRTANGSRQWNAGNVPELILPLITAPVTLTDQAAALGYFNQDNGKIYIADLSAFEQVRLTARIKTASASAASPRLRLGYNTSFQTTAASVVQLGRTSLVEASMFTGTNMGDSGWLDLAPGAQIDNCYLALLMIGGDATADPAVDAVMAHFR